MAKLAPQLNLELELDQRGDTEWIKFTLTSPRNTCVIKRWQQVSTNTLNRPYHRREALVIGLRQLVGAALSEGLISVSLGGSTPTSPTSTVPNESTMSETDWGFGSESTLI